MNIKTLLMPLEHTTLANSGTKVKNQGYLPRNTKTSITFSTICKDNLPMYINWLLKRWYNWPIWCHHYDKKIKNQSLTTWYSSRNSEREMLDPRVTLPKNEHRSCCATLENWLMTICCKFSGKLSSMLLLSPKKIVKSPTP